MQINRSLYQYLAGGEPFFHHGGKDGVLLIHGFTGSPSEMKGLGNHLAHRGYTVLAPRLAGHSTCPSDLRRTTWQDWVASAEDGIFLLRGECERIHLIGLSVGAIIAFYLAARHPVASVISMNGGLFVRRDWRLQFLPLLQFIYPYMKKAQPLSVMPERIRYATRPVRSIREVLTFMSETRRILPQLSVPVCLMQSRKDKIIPPRNLELLAELLGENVQARFWFEESGHVLSAGCEKELVWQRTADFLARC